MECEDIRRSLARGELPAEAESHLLACESCAALVVRHLMEQQALALPQPRSLLAAVEAEIERERGLVAWLRSRTTPTRWLLASGAGLALPLVVAALNARPDLRDLDAGARLACVAYAFAYLITLAEVLRPLHEPERAGLCRTLTLGAFGLPVFAALLFGLAPASRPIGGPPGCLGFGLLLAAGLLGALRVLDPGAHAAAPRAWLAAAAAGLVANLALTLHCADERLGHLLRWHAPVGFGLGLAYLVLRGFARPAPRSKLG